jgi:RNA polymerase sigma factor (sigma-70 family)
MPPAVPSPPLPEFALKLVRARARRLSSRNIIPAYERADIEQHLLLELWRRWRLFDGSRGSLPGFVSRIINNAVADLLRRHANEAPRRLVSLHDQVSDHDGNIVMLGDVLPENASLWGASSDLDETHLRVDLGKTMARLPSRLQELCRHLSCQPIAQIAREAGTSRSSIYTSLATIRRGFLDAGLRHYLADPPTLSRGLR